MHGNPPTPGQKWRIWACPHGRAASSLLGSKPRWISFNFFYQIWFSKDNPWDFEKIESWTGFSLLFTVFVLNLDFTCHLHETAFQLGLHAALWLAQQENCDRDTFTAPCPLLHRDNTDPKFLLANLRLATLLLKRTSPCSLPVSRVGRQPGKASKN